MIIDYATDTYAVFNFDKNEIFNQFAMSGRFITAYVGKLVKIINISESRIYIGSCILALIFIFLSILKLYKIIKKDVENRILQIIIPIIIIINPFSIELWLYIEKGIMWFGVYLSICAVEQLIIFLKTKQNKNILFGMIFMLCANFSYQGVVGIFASISLIYIIKYSKSIKSFIINNIIVAEIYGIPALIDLIFIKVLYKSNRVNGQILLSDSIKKILEDSKHMIFDTFELLPKKLFFLCICFTFGLFCCKIIMGKNVKNKTKKYFSFFYIVFGTIIITIFPHIIQPTKSIWVSPRSTYTFGSLFGILLIYNMINTNKNTKKNKAETIIIVILSFVIIVPMINSFYKILSDRYIVNEKDKKITMQIIDKIRRYEKQTGYLISKIEIYEDQNPKFTYDGVLAVKDINIKSYYMDWSTKEILEYYLKRRLLQEKKDINFNQYFLKKDWNEFSIDEQVFLKEDRIIICNY